VRKPVTIAQRQEAVALAAVIGVEAAARELGWDRRTVRKWTEQAGKPAELDGNAAAWQRAFDLAHAKVEGILASGKASAVASVTRSPIRRLRASWLRQVVRGSSQPRSGRITR